MNQITSKSSVRKRPIDWLTWAFWTILFIGLGICGFLIYQHNTTQIEVWVPIIDLPVYHKIVDSDVIISTKIISSLPSDVLRVNTSPVGNYTIQSVFNNHALSQSDLALANVNQLTKDTIPVILPATSIMTLNGQLRSGTIIDVWIVRHLNSKGSFKSEIMVHSALVLDVQQIENEAETKSRSYFIVLAVPPTYAGKLITASEFNQLVFTIVP